MQVFIVGSPLETAQALDPKRLNRQIQETNVILATLNGAKAWSNHPCVLQYRGCEEWLELYSDCLKSVQADNGLLAKACNFAATRITPDWHDQKYYDNMKARLYTKNPQHYAQFAEYGTSDYNLYYVDGEWRKYVNGKRVDKQPKKRGRKSKMYKEVVALMLKLGWID